MLAPRSSDADFRAARALQNLALQEAGVELVIETHSRMKDLGPRIELRTPGVRGQSYRLEVRTKLIEVMAEGPAALRYGVETLGQLIGPRGQVPACRVQDEPDLALRGIMIDISRGKVPTLETLRDLVDLCVRLKLNTLMLYTEHTFRFRRHPEIGRDAVPLDAATIRELDAYAAENHVELIRHYSLSAICITFSRSPVTVAWRSPIVCGLCPPTNPARTSCYGISTMSTCLTFALASSTPTATSRSISPTASPTSSTSSACESSHSTTANAP